MKTIFLLLTIAWQPVESAVVYRIYHSHDHRYWALITETTEPKVSIRAAFKGELGYYAVSAANSGGESAKAVIAYPFLYVSSIIETRFGIDTGIQITAPLATDAELAFYRDGQKVGSIEMEIKPHSKKAFLVRGDLSLESDVLEIYSSQRISVVGAVIIPVETGIAIINIPFTLIER